MNPTPVLKKLTCVQWIVGSLLVIGAAHCAGRAIASWRSAKSMAIPPSIVCDTDTEADAEFRTNGNLKPGSQ